jgi:uncharacterized protein YggE
MNDADGVLPSVRAEARQLVAPDYAVLDGLIEHTARSKADAAGSVAASVDRLTADLAARGAIPLDDGAGRRPLTWSAHSATTREERYHDKDTGPGQRFRSRVTATVVLRVTVRDLDTLDELSGVLAAHPGLNVHAVTWHADWDNPAWPQVRAAAIAAAIGKARDYAAALGVTVRQVEHIADAGLLGGDTAPDRIMAARPLSAGIEQPGTPALTPVPQELTAAIEARFRTTGLSAPALKAMASS